METLRIKDIQSVILQIKNIIDSNQDKLMELDSVMGDGDLGFTMTKAFAAAHEEADKSEEKIPGKLLTRLGMVIAKTSPSTMGTLVATGFMKGGKSIDSAEEIGPEELADFFESFVRSIMERGKSAPGNKTIIDTLFPAAEALRSSANESLVVGITAAREASLKGLEASTKMKAQHGRAAYYQDDSIGKQDGGATVGTYIVEGFYRQITQA
ncbi:MAG TPA: dihydroxyacetone kinase subunit L [Puia sp.]|nr:dihydroxyacetone kinase subunit L [Puia sp.]